MTDRLDDLLLSIGEEQNDRVDFDQMYADLLKKHKEEEKTQHKAFALRALWRHGRLRGGAHRHRRRHGKQQPL